jgi:16S rRNA (uracil1498-N3)-methyltransferase
MNFMKISSLSRIYTNIILTENKTIYFIDDDNHYLKNVLRVRLETKFRVFNGTDGEFLAQIIDISKNSVAALIAECLSQPKVERPLILMLSLIKIDKMLDAIDNAVQLGVTEIIPVIAQRSQIHTINIQKFSRRIIEATEQSERFSPPLLHQIIKLTDYNSRVNNTIIFANENKDPRHNITQLNLEGCITAIIGPEGGFTDNELEFLHHLRNSHSVSLGSAVLRTETAVTTILAQLQLLRQ